MRYDITDIAEHCKKHNIDIFEDCAEAYEGPSWTGTPECTVTAFSFGTIKHNTSY